MECFDHSGAAAVGLCKFCGKGICRDCARNVGPCLVCSSDRCAKSAAADEILRQRVMKACAIGDGKRKPNIMLIMLILFGTLFTGFGIYISFIRKHFEFLPIAMGTGFLVVALILYLQIRDLFKNGQDGKIPLQDGGQGGQHGNE